MSPARKHNRRGMHDARHVGPNMTPMVDVVMVILIFFMLGSSFVSPDWYLTNNTPAIKGGLSNVKTHAMPPTRINIKLRVRGTRTVAIMPGRRVIKWMLAMPAWAQLISTGATYL